MEIFITHLWKSAFIITIFYGFYKLFLQKETYFQSIRYFLLLGILLSITIPFITILKHVEVTPIEVITSNNLNVITPALESSINWYLIGISIYVVICAILFIKFIFQLISIALLIYRNNHKKVNGLFLVETTSITSPFSFFNFIVYNPAHFHEKELKQVLAHEKAHAIQLHSIDNLIANILVIICWFNPFAWLYQSSIMQNLEFIADDHAQKATRSQHSYQQLLLKTTIPNYQMALANNFYNSLLKKRIIMLHKQRSNTKTQWKFITLLPLLLTFVFTFNTNTIAQQKNSTTKIVTKNVNVFAMALDKESSDSDLKEISSTFLKKGLTVDFSEIVRNSTNNITAINISAKAKNGKAAASYASNLDDGINPIQISFDEKNNNLNIGATQSRHHSSYTYSTQGSGNRFVFLSDDHDDNKSVYVTKKGSKRIVVESHFDENDDHEEDIIKITTKKDGEKKKTTIISSNDDKDPLIILDGKEITKKEMEDLDADTIKSIDVLKGAKAIKKYGKKAKDGVVVITSK